MFPQSVFPDTAQIDSKGELSIGGCSASDLADEYGTPVYVLDEETLRARCRSFIDEFRKLYPNTNVSYASKAYINPALARIFQEEGMGFDVVSGGELATLIASEVSTGEIYFHGNNKTPQELSEALNNSIGWVVVDSFHELRLLDQLAREAGKTQDILIRVSPGVDPHTHVYTTTGVLDSKFGFSIQTGHAAEAVRMGLAAENLNLRGLHFHLGSPIFELEPYRVATELVLKFAAEFREEGLEMTRFSPGGGFAIGYTRDQEPPPVSDYAETIVSTMTATCQELGMEPPSLVIEPGRAIIGPAGVALYRIGAIKDVPGVRKFVSVDGGMGDNIRPALYQAEYEVVAATKANQEPGEKVTIAGKYCESGDLLASDIMLPSLESGDLLAIPAAGAYCPSMASNYNMNPRPPMVLVKDGKSRLIRRRESYQDLMHCDVV
ncbi:MAG TPA: diaminopimelate decarboxylase [Dehalococcoidia bacterium]|nr:diaminopimelate decarboxylase [Chloroflexota bacterium]MQF96375.1 diaminopimelate decarboxylase [SAR202 cluster bacterium]HAA94453.1 diaminopimelate decarboxylase [Dehalococcoidia bacterium]HCL25043.1 diaminopimelate decarboxylase [Dehalococcoidia bacterium]|tara:strand:- start:11979 stop:13286 length:1308 start_codon:yes stop_codon:yes gene_type:complete